MSKMFRYFLTTFQTLTEEKFIKTSKRCQVKRKKITILFSNLKRIQLI